jgi:hypothetical protein
LVLGSGGFVGYFLTHSDDKGVTWSDPIQVDTTDYPVALNDKPWLTADQNPASPHFGSVYATWTLFSWGFNGAHCKQFGPTVSTHLLELLLLMNSQPSHRKA